MLSLHKRKERTPFTANLAEVHQLALALLLPRPGCGLGILLLLCLDPAAAWGAGLHTLLCKGMSSKKIMLEKSNQGTSLCEGQKEKKREANV